MTGSVRNTVQVSSSGPTNSSTARKPKMPIATGFFGRRFFANRNPASMPPAP